jgi:cystathionine beta-lyase/cystathionine gamma-synthase
MDPRSASAGAPHDPGTDPRLMTDPRLATDPMLPPTPAYLADVAPAALAQAPGPPSPTSPATLRPPIVQPPIVQPPTAQPPTAQPPIAQPQLAQLPVAQPPISQPPISQPPIAQLPGAPLAIEPPRSGALSADGQVSGSQLAPPRRRPGENTRSVHLPLPPVPTQQPLTTPIYRTSTFAFTSSAEYAAVLADAAPGFSYSRIDNPTVTAFCTAVAALEGLNLSYQAVAQAFASGMAAVSGIFLAFTRAGAHVVASAGLYGGTYSFLRNVASNFGVQTDFVDLSDLGQVQAALRPGTSILYAETLANPTMAVADIASLARLAHDAGAMLVIDSTLAPPVICRPLEHGADLVLHSATKYFGGHSDVTGGVVTGHPHLIRQLRKLRIDTGGSLAPDDAYLLRRGLETLPLRVRRQCATAQVLAAGLAMHPAVSMVYYPGLTGHPGHQLARRQFDAGPEGTRFGSVVTVAPYGGTQAGLAFADRLRLARIAASLGGTHTKVSHVASTTHRQLDPAALAAAGIDPGSVRFSVGLEDGEDLLADAMAALDSLGRR